MTAPPFKSLTALCKGPHGEWKGKALSGADCKVCAVANPSFICLPLNFEWSFFVFAEGFVQLVAPRQTCLRCVSVGVLLRNYKPCADSQKQINFLSVYPLNACNFVARLRFPIFGLLSASAAGRISLQKVSSVEWWWR